ncbi:MAG: hypothetical protein RBU30_20000, partial [Polyangia bacterium]|nr:hypothetical protein [Polyangia bacterium]
MSEINPKPTEALTWGEGGTPNAHDEPLASCTDGYYEGTAPDHADADVLPAGHLNWLFRAFTRWFNWLAGLAHREFDEIDDAVTAGLAWPERFDYVRRAAVVEPGGQNYSVQGIAGAAFTAGTPIHDGRNVYYAQGGRLVCARLG